MSGGRRRDEGPRPLDASLDALARRLGATQSRGLAQLFAHWPDIVGSVVAEHVRPVRLQGTSLVVEVDHPAWATQVRHLGDDLLDRVAVVTDLARPSGLEIRVRP